jgi:hypothetical protein
VITASGALPLTLQGPASTIVDMDSSGDPPLPLAGFRVLDLTAFLAGPYAAMAAQ